MADKERIRKLIEKRFGKLEKIEASKGMYKQKELVETDYPKPLKRQFLVYENYGGSVEEIYFWVKDVIGDLGFTDVEKIVDTYTATEQSAFFGSAQQRLGAQQNIASNYLATIGKMVKEMFQIVRDIQLLDEREVLYDKAAGIVREDGVPNPNKRKAPDDGAEKALKGVWIDFVDNGPGQLKASSVYGLATQLGYTVLPDLFFSAPANLQLDDVSRYVETLKKDFNEKVRTALVRKLEQYVAWRDATAKQITSKKNFTVKYLRQHYNAIKMYVDWVKPYLKNIRRLLPDPEGQLSAEIVGAFEGSFVEVEFIAKKPGNPHASILVTFKFRTRPIMQTGQDYQRGPAHIGRAEMTFRGYVWSDEDIKDYKEIRQQEDFEMLKSIDSSIEESMNYLEEDLRKYLSGYNEKFGGEKKKETLARSIFESGSADSMEQARARAELIISGQKKGPSFFAPFTSIIGGVKDIGKGFVPTKNELKKEEAEKQRISEEKKEKAGLTRKMTAKIFTLFKKSRKLIVP